MCALVYKHRPSGSALMAALLTLIGGTAIVCGMARNRMPGEGILSEELLVGCATFLFIGIFLVIAFARYKFTHLWVKSRPSVREGTRSRHVRCR